MNPDRPLNEVPRIGRLRDWLLGGGLLAALILAVHHQVGWGALLSPWLALSPWLLAWLFLLSALSYALRAFRVYDYFRPRFAGRLLIVLRLSVLHNTANNLLPMRAGEMVFPWLMRRYFGQGFLDSTAALMWIRVLDLHFLVLVALLVLNLTHPSWLWWAAAGLWLAGLSLMGFARSLGASHWLAGSGRLRVLAQRILSAAPRDGWLVARVYLWTALIWALKLAAFSSVLKFFLPLDLGRLLAGVLGAELSSVLPFHGIAGSGSYELAAVAALLPFGVDPELALAGAVNLHLFLLGVTLILGGLALLLPKRGRRIRVGNA
ncbi:flippase-like domain-containing protein [Thiorhodococcus mannitoliphagus]|uniref:Flippase-like domain-containing protein n=1 Tax=Thiorhodococcus mannitoliphagus TaxID=329406 RepID=A0A6P1DW07_9GAMM|nr:flippase-like domain-containing protein [Thiorhodococcus mannitoliphagus]